MTKSSVNYSNASGHQISSIITTSTINVHHHSSPSFIHCSFSHISKSRVIPVSIELEICQSIPALSLRSNLSQEPVNQTYAITMAHRKNHRGGKNKKTKGSHSSDGGESSNRDRASTISMQNTTTQDTSSHENTSWWRRTFNCWSSMILPRALAIWQFLSNQDTTRRDICNTLKLWRHNLSSDNRSSLPNDTLPGDDPSLPDDNFCSLDDIQPWALIIGALEPWGAGIADELCSAGFDVVLQGKQIGKLYALSNEIRDRWPGRRTRILGYCDCDIGCDETFIKRCTHRLEDIHLRVVVNKLGYAGTSEPAKKSENGDDEEGDDETVLGASATDEDEPEDSTPTRRTLSEVMDRNIRSMTDLTRLVRPLLTKHGRPSLIINAGPCGVKFFELLFIAMYSSGVPSCLNIYEVVENYAFEVVHMEHAVDTPPGPHNSNGAPAARHVECERQSSCPPLLDTSRVGETLPQRTRRGKFPLHLM
jgi:hypothetical protein